MCTALEELKKAGIEIMKIFARYEDGMQPEEIACKMGLTVKQIEEILKKCVQSVSV